MCFAAMGDRNAARISVSEMKNYYIYSEWCSWLLSVAEGESLGPEKATSLWDTHRRHVGNSQGSGCDGHCFDVIVTWVVLRGDGAYRFLVLAWEDVFMPHV